MKKISLKIFVVILGVSCFILSSPIKVNAVLQSNPNTHGAKKDTSTNWMTNIRNMETANQAMGLEEKIDGTTNKATSASNNIDVHMMKTTEYGAVAILSASGYGNPEWVQNSEIKSTTGNKSGVYYVLENNYERTAGGLEGKIFSGVDAKYYDAYTSDRTSVKVGDALGDATTANPGCAGWHDTKETEWVGGTTIYFIRGTSGVFGRRASINTNGLGRAVVVCGDGF